MNQHITSSPLTWPEGWKHEGCTEHSRFFRKGEGYRKHNITIAAATQFVLAELHRMGIPDFQVIISTDLKLRKDGLPYSSQREPDDQGAAVWWTDPFTEKQQVIALAKYNRIADNIYAIGKTIEALRGIERWGGGEILNRTFTGFTGIPHMPEDDWRSVLNYHGEDYHATEILYKKARSREHPDNGGDPVQFHRINDAWVKAREHFGVK